VLKKNREKSGELLDGKKPVRIKKPHGGGGERQKTQWDKKNRVGGTKRLASGMGAVGWRYDNEFTVNSRLGALIHTLILISPHGFSGSSPSDVAFCIAPQPHREKHMSAPMW